MYYSLSRERIILHLQCWILQEGQEENFGPLSDYLLTKAPSVLLPESTMCQIWTIGTYRLLIDWCSEQDTAEGISDPLHQELHLNQNRVV